MSMFYRLFIESSFLYFLESIDQLAKIASEKTGKDFSEVKSFLSKFSNLAKTAREKSYVEDLERVFKEYYLNKRKFNYMNVPTPFFRYE